MLPEIILASTSPRRVQLLHEAGHAFRTVSPEIEESAAEHFTPRELTLLNARRKAHAVAAFFPLATVIAADTVVAVDGQTLGKPADLEDARRMLRLLSGREHAVMTSVWMVRLQPWHVVTFTEQTRVFFRSLSETEIHQYLSLIEPLDKAGAYAAQEHARIIIERVEGSLSNVIGLPMESVQTALEEFQKS